MSTGVAADKLRTLREEREDMIRAAVTYFDEPNEDESLDADQHMRFRNQGTVPSRARAELEHGTW